MIDMLRFDTLRVAFTQAQQPALDDFSLVIPAGAKTMIIGETGSGKSVLLLALLRLLPASASVSGQIWFEGKDLQSIPDEELRRLRGATFSYIPQSSGSSLNPLLTVGFQVGETLIEKHGYSRRSALAESMRLLEQFELDRRVATCYPHQLSGGMRQRALIAMGMAVSPRLLLADEPTKGLDGRLVDDISACFCRLRQQIMLVVSHDLDFTEQVGNFVSVLYAGQQIEYGCKADFFTQPLHPYSQALLAARPRAGLKSLLGFAPPQSQRQTGCRFRERCLFRREQCEVMPDLFETRGRKVRCWLYAD